MVSLLPKSPVYAATIRQLLPTLVSLLLTFIGLLPTFASLPPIFASLLPTLLGVDLSKPTLHVTQHTPPILKVVSRSLGGMEGGQQCHQRELAQLQFDRPAICSQQDNVISPLSHCQPPRALPRAVGQWWLRAGVVQ
jgi:hypothetical protein